MLKYIQDVCHNKIKDFFLVINMLHYFQFDHRVFITHNAVWLADSGGTSVI